ncbi:MAG: hypothetical protein R2773_05360 [Flavobacteriaceae bacterium]
MKLLIITAITAFEEDIKQLLKRAHVATFSYKHVTGFRDATMDSVGDNWFGSEMNENESVLFYAFLKKEKVDHFFQLVDAANSKLNTLSKIHVASIAIDKTNTL